MTLQINEKERAYLAAIINDDMVEFPDGDPDFLSEEERNKLLAKIEALS